MDAAFEDGLATAASWLAGTDPTEGRWPRATGPEAREIRRMRYELDLRRAAARMAPGGRVGLASFAGHRAEVLADGRVRGWHPGADAGGLPAAPGVPYATAGADAGDPPDFTWTPPQ